MLESYRLKEVFCRILSVVQKDYFSKFSLSYRGTSQKLKKKNWKNVQISAVPILL